MSSFELLMHEHEELTAQVDDLLKLIGLRHPAVGRVFQARRKLEVSLAAHLANEDAVIYPRLMACEDAPTAHLAKNFEADFGKLVDAWSAYLRTWDEAAARQNWRGFSGETRTILALLAARIRSEDELLYPAALAGSVIGLRDRAPANAPA